MLFLCGLMAGAGIGAIWAAFVASLRYEELEAKYQGLLREWLDNAREV